jgi:hypothetical protein
MHIPPRGLQKTLPKAPYHPTFTEMLPIPKPNLSLVRSQSNGSDTGNRHEKTYANPRDLVA